MRNALLTAIVVTAAGCGSAGGVAITEPPSGTEPPPPTQPPQTTTVPPTTVELPETFPVPTDPAAVVFRIDQGVNQPDPVAVASGFPLFTLYGDGRLIARDPSVESGALPRLVEARLTPEGVQAIVQLAARHGALRPLDRYGSPAIGDADSLSFFVDFGSSTSDFGVYALGLEQADDPDVSPEQYAARRELRSLTRAVSDWRTALAEHLVEPPALFVGEQLLVMGDRFGDSVVQGTLPIDMTLAERVDTRVEPIRCRTVAGAELDALVPTLLAGEPVTAWTIDGEAWSLAFRPVFPGEPGCAIVPDQ